MTETKLKLKSHIETRRDASVRCAVRVMNLLHWTELEYGAFKYQIGLSYLKQYTKDEQAICRLERTKVFWNWWKIHWTIREEQWLLDYQKLQQISLRYRLKSYKSQHDPGGLAQEIYPNAKVLGESYAEMMQKIIDESHLNQKIHEKVI